MKSNRIILGLLAAALCGIGYLGSKIYVDQRLELIDVPVAASVLQPRTLISEDDIVMIKVPKAYLQNSIVLDIKDLIGKYTLIRSQIPQGSFIYDSMVESIEQAKDSPSLLLLPNQVVYALDVDLKMTSGNTLQPFQKIDLYVSILHNRLTVVDRLISNVRILSLKDKNGKELEKATDIPKLMLIALDQDQVSILTKAIELGDLIITPGSNQSLETESILIQDTALLKVLHER
ncbi:MAG: Flp pilus assembly protein CpaB [Erysipelotrichaceae bacterium]|nr:MAG: Flp pilus assembly protein [Erysipelotrichaceae bacterium]TXT19010.1 MAG: Flp pilus assembly protein CpaB [Erysipelotrichaceae bacterium]